MSYIIEKANNIVFMRAKESAEISERRSLQENRRRMFIGTSVNAGAGEAAYSESLNENLEGDQGKSMSNEAATNHYAYQGPLGEVIRHGRTFSARKDGFLIATYNTFDEAMASLAWKGRAKAWRGQL